MIKLENVSYTYMKGGPFEKKALDNVSLEVKPGEFIGVIGHTGSGKSTMIQMLNGLLKPSEGRVFIDGTDINDKGVNLRDIRFKVGLVMQYPEYQLFEETVYRDISFGPKNMGLPEEEIRRRVLRAAQFAGVPEALLEKSPFDLSGGQKRRVAIAGVIAMEPEIVVFDEPTAGLDPAGCAGILENIENYRKTTGATILMVSHSMDDVAKMADRLLVLREGENVMCAPPGEVFSNAEELRAIGLSVPQVTELFLRLRALGLPVNPAVYTVPQALAQLLSLKEGTRHA